MKGVVHLIFLGLLALFIAACSETQVPELTPNLTVTVSPGNAVVNASVAGKALSASTEGELTLQGRSVYRYQANGEYVVVRADADGYEPFEKRVFVRNGQTAEVDIKLPERGKGKPVSVTIHIDAGEDQTIELGDTAILQGVLETDSKDFIPEVTWSAVSGPGKVSFDADDQVVTGAMFSEIGVYRLRITGSISTAVVYDDLKVKVRKPSAPTTPDPQEPEPSDPDPQEPEEPDPSDPDPEEPEPSEPDPGIPSTGDADHPLADLPGFQRTLLDTYRLHRKVTINSKTYKEIMYRHITYKPRSSAYEGYEGWDVLKLPLERYIKYDEPDWVTLNFNRDTRVVVLWAHEASWLSGWDKGSLNGLNTFTKNVAKGELVIPPPGTGKGTYTLLFAEKDGVPSAELPLPDGVSERPQANQTCPTWLHDSYLTEGPEGGLYQTWHPQIDPAYWCYFGHEHGSDPALVNYQAAYKYVADKNFRQNEQHEGFKGFSIRDEEKGLGWYFNVHATTSAAARLCTRFHTVVIAVTDLETGELLAELGYKGDFGALRTTEKIDGEHVLIQPGVMSNCPNQAAIAEKTDAVKLVRAVNVPGVKPGRYEKWLGGLQPTIGLSHTTSHPGFTLDVRTPQTACDGLACNRAVPTGLSATARMMFFPKVTLAYTDSVKALDLADGKQDGVFYTDPYGTVAAEPGGDTSIRQYVKPGLLSRIDGFAFSVDAWQFEYKLNEGRANTLELESSIGEDN